VIVLPVRPDASGPAFASGGSFVATETLTVSVEDSLPSETVSVNAYVPASVGLKPAFADVSSAM
jgi:hypothetical protein